MYVGQQYVLSLQPKWGRNEVDGCGNSRASDQVRWAEQRKLGSASGLNQQVSPSTFGPSGMKA